MTLRDQLLSRKVPTKPVDLDGLTVYVRQVSYGDLLAVEQAVQALPESERDVARAGLSVLYGCCDADGKRLFASAQEVEQLPIADVRRINEAMASLNQVDVDAAKKN